MRWFVSVFAFWWIEFEDKGTLIDAVNRAVKRKIVCSAEKIREIRELRNEIAHEYTDRQLKDLFGSVLEFSEDLFVVVKNTKIYMEKYKEN